MVNALGFLREEHKKVFMHAVVFTDLNMKALTIDLIDQIGSFCESEDIPIIVEPNLHWEAYQRIEVTCAVLSLAGWRHIVDDPQTEEYRFSRLSNNENLTNMGMLSLQHMPNVRFLIINCYDVSRRRNYGPVLIARNGDEEIRVWHLRAHQQTMLMDQLGAPHVYAGALAVQIARLHASGIDAESMLEAVRRAGTVLACYLDPECSSWHRVPTHAAVGRYEQRMSAASIATAGEAAIRGGVLLLPQTSNLATFAVLGSDLVTQDPTYRDEVEKLRKWCVEPEYWQTAPSSPLRGAILTSQGGGGKSSVVERIKRLAEAGNIRTWSDFDPKPCADIVAAVEAVQEYRKSQALEATDRLLVCIDEAFNPNRARHLLCHGTGKMFMQLVNDRLPTTRFLFVDADYLDVSKEPDFQKDQFENRCDIATLPDLASRRRDIALIFAKACFDAAKGTRSEFRLNISEAALIATINWVLTSNGQTAEERRLDQNAKGRVLVARAREAVRGAQRDWDGGGGSLEVRVQHLPPELRPASSRSRARDTSRLLEFRWIVDDD